MCTMAFVAAFLKIADGQKQTKYSPRGEMIFFFKRYIHIVKSYSAIVKSTLDLVIYIF